MSYAPFISASNMLIGFTTSGTHITASGGLRPEFSYGEVDALDAPIFFHTGSMISHTSEALKETSPVARCAPVPGWWELQAADLV